MHDHNEGWGRSCKTPSPPLLFTNFRIAECADMDGKAKYEFIDDGMLDEVCAEGRRSPRLRMNRNFHRSTDEAVNRLLNAMHRGSYIPVHRHLSPERSESCVVLRGRAGLTIYDDEGRVTERRIAGPCCGCAGFDLGRRWGRKAPASPRRAPYRPPAPSVRATLPLRDRIPRSRSKVPLCAAPSLGPRRRRS